MNASVVFDEAVIRRYDRPGPRYTSYPTAAQFTTAFGPDDFIAAARSSNDTEASRPLSLYIHVPFCASPCFYCGCNKVITRDLRKGDLYLNYLMREIDLVSEQFDRTRPVDQLHFGGGTPTFLTPDQIARVLAKLQRSFLLRRDDSREYSIEVDPRTVDTVAISRLAELGFNRVSFGIQDFDPLVQEAVNRVQPEAQTLQLIDHARAAGFLSISVDLIYGLPKQTLPSFARTLDLVIRARPDRVAAYSYAHLPHLFKAQRQIRTTDLPSASEKLGLLGLSVERLTAAGYVYVGMDHFAVPEDELVRAERNGGLHRTFQGYSTHVGCDLVGLGVSSISNIGPTYSQNVKRLNDYYRAIDANRPATERGIQLNEDDRLRADVIQGLMCSAGVDLGYIEARHGIDFDAYFARELRALDALMRDDLVSRVGRKLRVTQRGRLLLRNVAMVFDKYLALPPSPGASSRHSRTI